MIPELNPLGLLPPGIHTGTLDEVSARFTWTHHRAELLNGLMRLLDEWWKPQGLTAELLIDGSFARSKALPEDIDVVFKLDPETAFDDVAAFSFRCLIERPRLKMVYHVDVWPSHPLIPNDLVQFFQYAGDKASAELRIDKKHPKGIIRIAP